MSNETLEYLPIIQNGLPPRETIISCQDVCVRKASAPKPGGHPSGHLERQCVNTLTGQFIGTRPIPFTACGP